MSKREPAFPSSNDVVVDATTRTHGHAGMTLRDYFAAHAPVYQWLGMNVSDSHQQKAAYMAEWNYAYADAMLAERDK